MDQDMPTQQPEHEWHFGTYAVLVVGFLTAVMAVVAFPYHWYTAWTPATVSVGGALLTALIGWARKSALAVTAYRAASWMIYGGWATSICLIGMSFTAFLVGGGLFVALLMVAGLFIPDDEGVADVVREGGVLTTTEAMEWKKRIDRICRVDKPGVTITRKEDWENGTGYTLTVEGPEGSGFSFRNLADEIDKLGSAARMKPGCILSASEGDDHQGQAMLNVPTAYDLANTRLYPRPYGRLSVNRLVPIGFFPDGTPVEIEVREGSMLAIGRKGGGKTTLLHNITASFARCSDALIWHIDMNNGGMSAPWLLPWMQNEVDLPVLDWFANTEDEALIMSQVALAIVLHRKAVYAGRAAAANQSNVPLDDDVPEIFIMIDEAAEALGEDTQCLELGENIRKIMRLGRAVGVNVLISALRPVGDHLPVQVRKGCVNRIGMRVEEDDEYDYLFPGNSKGLQPHMIRNRGEGFIFRGEIDSSPVKFRTFDMKPDQILEITRETIGLRPQLDAKSLAAKWDRKPVAVAYEKRWERCAEYLYLLVDSGVPTPDARLGEDRDPEPQSGAVATIQQPDVDFEAAVLADLDKLLVSEPERPNATGRTQTLTEGAQLVVGIVTEPMMMARILGEVDAAGQKVTRQTVNEWVKQAIAAERIEPTTKKGQYQPVGWTAPQESED